MPVAAGTFLGQLAGAQAVKIVGNSSSISKALKTIRPRTVNPEPCVPNTTGFPLRSAIDLISGFTSRRTPPEMPPNTATRFAGRSSFAEVEYHNLATGKLSWLTYAPVTMSGWSMGIVYPVDELTAPPEKLFSMVILLAVIGAAILLLAIVLISRSITRPLRALAFATQHVSRGKFDVPLPAITTKDEIGELTRNLNNMAEQLQTLLHTRDELARIEERNRLARDLHDTVKQQTYAARMQLSAAKNMIGSNPNAAAEHIESALQLNRETQQELKLIIDELRPAALEGKGLAQALSEYAERWQEHTGIKVTTTISGGRALPLDVEQALYRVVQESLSNVARHAEADRVGLNLSLTPDKVTLVIVDNGRGFEPNGVSSASLGLASMKQRLAEVGGTLNVESTLGVGSTFQLTLPHAWQPGESHA